MTEQYFVDRLIILRNDIINQSHIRDNEADSPLDTAGWKLRSI